MLLTRKQATRCAGSSVVNRQTHLVEFSLLGSDEPVTLLIEMSSVVGLVDTMPVSLHFNSKE